MHFGSLEVLPCQWPVVLEGLTRYCLLRLVSFDSECSVCLLLFQVMLLNYTSFSFQSCQGMLRSCSHCKSFDCSFLFLAPSPFSLKGLHSLQSHSDSVCLRFQLFCELVLCLWSSLCLHIFMTVCFLLGFVFVPYLFPLKAIHLFDCLLTLRDRYLCHQLLCLFALDFFYSFV